MSRSLWILAALALALGAGAAYYFFPAEVRSVLSGTPLDFMAPGATRLYRWQDDRGDWHVTDQVPTDGRPYETLEYRRDTNILPRPDED